MPWRDRMGCVCTSGLLQRPDGRVCTPKTDAVARPDVCRGKARRPDVVRQRSPRDGDVLLNGFKTIPFVCGCYIVWIRFMMDY